MINELIIAGAAFFHPPVLLDSIGTETINGKVFVLHQVGEKETLYAISRRYGVPVETIVQHNPSSDTKLDIGQVLKVPYIPKRTKAADASTHVVTTKETMFSISQLYGVSVDDLKQWNNLTSNALAVGQELIIKKPGTVPAGAATTPVPVIPFQSCSCRRARSGSQGNDVFHLPTIRHFHEELKDWNKLEGDEIGIGQELVVVAPKPGPARQHPQRADGWYNNHQCDTGTTVVATQQPVRRHGEKARS